MLKVSEAFRTAIRNGAPQRALLRFSNATFGNDDISITGGGIRLTEIINGDTNLHYGLCSSARLEVSLINRDSLLEMFDFGEFTASIGVLTSTEMLAVSADVAVKNGDGTVFSVGEDGYLYVNGQFATLQTVTPLKLLVIQDNILYMFGRDRIWTRGKIGSDGVTLTAVTSPPLEINELSWQKLEALMRNKACLRLSYDKLVECRAGKAYTYEFAPLGTFIAPKPNVLRKTVIELEAEDKMQLFDSDLSDVEFAYPLTMTEAYYTLCQSVGVEYVAQNIPNGDLTLTSKPDLFDGATKRDVLGWIAEASATYARFNREGKLELTRFNETGVEYDEHDYVSASPSAYSVKPYGKLHIRNADSNIEQVVGEGENAYLIQDNPFLKPQTLSVQTRSATAAASAAPTDEILTALGELGTFSPVVADTFADWTMQAGDVVTIKSGDDAYKTPLYTMNMTWKGSPRVTMESTGDEKPQPIPVFERRRYAGGRSAARAKEENEEFKTWAEFHIDEAEANIRFLTGSVTTATGEYINVEAELNGLRGVVSQKAEASVVTEQGNLITAAQQEINGLKGEISDKASKSEVTAEGQRVLTEAGQLITASEGRIMQYVTVYDGQGNPLSSVQLALDAKANTADLTANYVTINALETTVSGLLKVDELRAAIAELKDVAVTSLSVGEDAHCTNLYVHGASWYEGDLNVSPGTVYAGAGEFDDVTIANSLTLNGTAFNPSDYLKTSALPSKLTGYATESWVIEQGYVTASDITTGVTTKSLYIPTDGKITIPSGADFSLFGYKPRKNKMDVLTGGKCKATNSVTASFMLADGSTKTYTFITGVSFEPTIEPINYLYMGS